MKLLSGVCHGTPLVINQHWLRYWFGAVRLKAITRANVHPDLCVLVASLGQKNLTQWSLDKVECDHSLGYCNNIFLNLYIHIWTGCVWQINLCDRSCLCSINHSSRQRLSVIKAKISFRSYFFLFNIEDSFIHEYTRTQIIWSGHNIW